MNRSRCDLGCGLVAWALLTYMQGGWGTDAPMGAGMSPREETLLGQTGGVIFAHARTFPGRYLQPCSRRDITDTASGCQFCSNFLFAVDYGSADFNGMLRGDDGFTLGN